MLTNETLIVFQGFPGSGKSTLSSQLAEELHWKLFSADTYKSNLSKEGVPDSILSKESYQLLWKNVETALRTTSCVADCNINSAEKVTTIQDIQRRTHTEIKAIRTICPDVEQLRQRFVARGASHEFHLAVNTWEKYQDYITNHSDDFSLPFPTITIDTSKPVLIPNLINWLTES